MEFLFQKTFAIFVEYKRILKYRLKFKSYQIKDFSRNKVFTWDLTFIHWN